MTRTQFLTICLLLLAGIWVLADIARREARSVVLVAEDFSARVDRLSVQVAELRAEVATMRAGLVRNGAYLRSSNAGECHPEIRKMIAEAWERSEKTLTLSETIRLAGVESRWLPWVVNGQSVGLFQLQPCSVLVCDPSRPAAQIERLKDPGENSRLAMRHLDDLVKVFETKDRILRAWTWGSTRTRHGITDGAFSNLVLTQDRSSDTVVK